MNRPTRILTIIAVTAAVAAPASVWLAPAARAASILYAYADGAGSPAGCTQQGTSTNGCSLTTAIATAASGDTIDLATPGSSLPYVGGWTIGSNLTIQPASGVANPTLDGGGTNRILTISSAVQVSLAGLTLTNGSTAASGGAISGVSGSQLTITSSTVSDNSAATGSGGAINTPGTLTITGSTFVGNSAHDAGGAINAGGTTSISDSTFGGSGPAGNAVTFYGGAVFSSGGLTVTNSTFTGNNAKNGGGAIVQNSGAATPVATITGSTFNANTSFDDGGAILNGNGASGVLVVSSSTFEANSASGEGGAIYNAETTGDVDTVSATASTFAGDVAASGGPAIAVGVTATAASITVAGDLFAEGCSKGATGTWSDSGYNAATDGTCLNGGTGDQTNANVSTLGGLANNGGPTQTRMPTAPNAAIGMIPDPTTGFCPRTDQRGYSSSGACTAGAVEPNGVAPGGGGGGGGGPAPENVIVTSSANPSGLGDPVTFTATLSPAPTCGNVSWLIDNSTPPSGTPSGGSGATWTLGPISSLSVGVHFVTAVFSGCSLFGPGSGTVNQEVDKTAPSPTPTPTSTGTPSPTPSSTSTGGIVPPKIVAHVSNAFGLHNGWYRSPVRITFTCTPGSAPLTGPCPGPITIRHNGRHIVRRTITATDGGTASVKVIVNLDQTGPVVHVDGVTNGKTYETPPTLTCTATDSLSGHATCTIAQHHHHINGTDDAGYHYVVIATDAAGNTTTISGNYRVS